MRQLSDARQVLQVQLSFREGMCICRAWNDLRVVIEIQLVVVLDECNALGVSKLDNGINNDEHLSHAKLTIEWDYRYL